MRRAIESEGNEKCAAYKGERVYELDQFATHFESGRILRR